MLKTSRIDNYRVGDEVFDLIVFPYSAHGEVDFEVYQNGEYLYTLTSNRPDLSTSVVWRYIKGIPCDAITYCSKDSL